MGFDHWQEEQTCSNDSSVGAFESAHSGPWFSFRRARAKASRNHSKTRKACGGARKAARAFEADGHLRQARETYESCSKAICSPVVRQDCTTRYAQLAHDIPTIVPLVTDEAGTPLVDVQVTMDGAPIASRLDGRSIAVDPACTSSRSALRPGCS